MSLILGATTLHWNAAKNSSIWDDLFLLSKAKLITHSFTFVRAPNVSLRTPLMHTQIIIRQPIPRIFLQFTAQHRDIHTHGCDLSKDPCTASNQSACTVLAVKGLDAVPSVNHRCLNNLSKLFTTSHSLHTSECRLSTLLRLASLDGHCFLALLSLCTLRPS